MRNPVSNGLHYHREIVRAAGLCAALIACLALSATVTSSALAADVKDPVVVAAAQKAAASTPAGLTERFKYGLYDAASGDVYVDGNTDAVWRLQGDELVPAPTSKSGPTFGTLEACGYGVYFHCESTIVRSGCTPTTFWLNYNPTTDNFSDPSGHKLNPPEQVSVRDEPYRRYGPRSVRAEHDGIYGFYSMNCVSG